MKLDPEDWVIAAALDQAELEDANERGAAARIEFKPDGHAKVTITISRELVEQAETGTTGYRTRRLPRADLSRRREERHSPRAHRKV